MTTRPLSLVLLAGLAACRPEPRPAPPPVEAPAAQALALQSTDACRQDADCAEGTGCFQGVCTKECAGSTGCGTGESCSSRGRCITAAGAPAAPEAAPQLRVTNNPPERLSATRGQASVRYRLELNQDLPAGGLVYRVERSDDPMAGATLLRAKGTRFVDLDLAVGAADPARGAMARLVDVTLYTSVGRFTLRIEPAVPVSGTYAGSLAITNLGTVPVEFQLVTVPTEATLATATQRFVVLEVTKSGFLSPRELPASASGAVRLAAPLTLDTLTNKYVARFNHAFGFGPMDSQVFQPAAGTAGRGLRFELTQAPNGAVQGNVVDVWSGLFELQGLSGTPEPATTYAIGTLEVRRTGDAVTPAEVMGLPAGPNPAVPVAQGSAPLDACNSAILNMLAPTCHDADPGTDDVMRFVMAPAATRATCANDAVAALLASPNTVTAKLAQYTSATAPTAGSFQMFLEDCRQGTNGTCVTSRSLLCARQLAAHAFQGLDGDATRGNVVLRSYLDATREAALGPQLGAFWADYQARLQWLQVDGAPSIVASALTNDSLARLQAWRMAVLDKHMGTLALQLDGSARAVFARVPQDTTLAGARVNALSQVSQSWRGAVDALTFMVRRWNVLQQDDTARAAAAADARGRARDLYLAASVVTGLSGSSGSIATAPFRGAFGNLVRGIEELGLPFQNLVFARDAEVVVSTSLDPMSSSATILAQRRMAALTALESARLQVNEVVDGVIADGLNQLQFTGALAVELQAAQADLQRLCGLPMGCTASMLGTTPACTPRVAAGQCGFQVDQDGNAIDFQSQASTSRAGAQVLEVVKAYNTLRIAAAARDAQLNTVAYSQANLDAFYAAVQGWNQKRSQTLSQMAMIFAQQNTISDTALRAVIAKRAQAAQVRQDAIAGDADDIEKWNQLRLGTVETTIQRMANANAFTTASDALAAAAEVTEFVVPLVADLKFAAAGIGGALSGALKAGSITLSALAAREELAAQRVQAYADAKLSNLMDLASLSGAQTDADLAELQAAIDNAQGVSANQLAELNRALELGKEQRAAEIAFGRDLAAFEDKRLAHFALVQQLPRFQLEVEQASLGVQQRILEYRLTVQDAQLAESRRALLQAQFNDASTLLGSPAVVFSRVNRLDRADLLMQTARDRLMDWLTALEYLAVRPFVDHRIRILLARNPLQLERVALSMEQIQNTCGGNTSQATLDVSVRDDLLGMTQAIVDVDGSVISPGARFRAALQRASVPIDRRVRYSTDSTIGGLISRGSGVLAASFPVSLSRFGNLALACNAKMVSFDVQLVGDVGAGQPVVTLLYDGTSQVRSCQPDIDAYVQSIGGSKWTKFGATTLFNTVGRAASPNAGINAYLAGSNGNVTLDGLPLASEYTVLIDTTVGDNARLDWTKLEDVRLRIRYGYQDLFAAGQCRE
ncbi:MAG: hypothetical protein MUC96_15215 [Myxococcaceae bacterium]|jgi:hypothetical protein|nr:hypothetical protein [Myxococcaceae bacterium]